jgi:hypothetical protein
VFSHSVVGFSSTNDRRLQQHQNTLSRVPVGVVLTADQVYQPMAERHASERSLGPYFFVTAALDYLADFFRKIQVLRICIAIDQERPINVAALRKFIPRQRAKKIMLTSAESLPIKASRSSFRLASARSLAAIRWDQLAPHLLWTSKRHDSGSYIDN